MGRRHDGETRDSLELLALQELLLLALDLEVQCQLRLSGQGVDPEESGRGIVPAVLVRFHRTVLLDFVVEMGEDHDLLGLHVRLYSVAGTIYGLRAHVGAFPRVYFAHM